MAFNFLLIDNRLPDLNIIINSLNSNTDYFIFDFYNDTIENILLNIPNKSYNSFGLMQHNYNLSYFNFISSDNAILNDISINDPSLTSWNNIINFINNLKTNNNISYFDFIACSIYSDPNWKYIINKLEIDLNINIRASNDLTGNIYDANWYLETDNIDLKEVYFTENILNYQHNLIIIETLRSSYHKRLEILEGVELIDASAFTLTNTNIDNLSAKKIYTTGTNFVVQTSDTNIRYHNGLSFTVASGEIIKEIYTTQTNIAILTTSGRVYSLTESGGTATNYNDISNNLLSGVNKIYTSNSTFVALKTNNTIVSWGTDSTERNISGINNSDIIDILPTYYAFYLKKSNGRIERFGQVSNTETRRFIDISNNLSDVIKIETNFYTNSSAIYIGLKQNGSVEVWGNINIGTVPTSSLTTDCIDIIMSGSIQSAFCVLKKNSSVVIFGNSGIGGTNTTNVDLSSGIIKVMSNYYGFTALKNNGSVIYWGNNNIDVSFNINDTGYNSDCIKIFTTEEAVAVLKKDGTVKIFGMNNRGGLNNSGDTLTNIINIIPTAYTFYGIKNNGKVINWGSNGNTIRGTITNTNFINIIGISIGNNAIGLRIANINNYNNNLATNYDRYQFFKYLPKTLNNTLISYPSSSIEYLINNTDQIQNINPKLTDSSYYYRILDSSNNIHDLPKNKTTLIPVSDGEIINEYNNNILTNSYINYNNNLYNYTTSFNQILGYSSITMRQSILKINPTNFIWKNYDVYEPMKLDDYGTLILNPVTNQTITKNTSLWYDASGFVRTDTDTSGSINKIALKIENGVINMLNSYLIGSSDIRIKKNIRELDDIESYNIIKNIDIVKYDYIDEINNSDKDVIGFIAQNINENIPNAVRMTENIIPNIYKLLDIIIIDNKTISVIIPEDINLENIYIGQYIYVYDYSNNRYEGKIKDKINNELLIEAEVLKMNIYNSKLFIYGVKINNFLNLNKDRIFAVFASGTQQLIRDKEVLEEKVELLEETISLQNQMINNLQNQINEILVRLNNANIN